jgi:hypothetical protein
MCTASYFLYFSIQYNDRRGRDRMVDLQLHVQSVPITTKVVSSNPATDFVCLNNYEF